MKDLGEALKEKIRQLESLNAERASIESSLNQDDTQEKDQKIRELRTELQGLNKAYLEILEEKNRMYEDLTT